VTLRFLATGLVALILGAALGRYVLAPDTIVIERIKVVERIVEVQAPPPPPPKPVEPPTVKLRVLTSYPVSLPQFGTLAQKLAERVKRVSDGRFLIEFELPGRTIAPDKCLDEASKGEIDGCWSTPGMWSGKDPSFAIFGGHPFGPAAVEHVAWMLYGGGNDMLDLLYARHDVKSLMCGATSAEAGGWFRKPVEGVENLRGLRIRAFGLAARVYKQIGAEPLHLDAQRMMEAVKTGEIDAAEYSFPLIDASLGLHEHLTQYYFPGWQQPTTPLELLINRKVWDQLPLATKAMLESACAASIQEGLAEGEALQAAALRELKARGVTFHRWPQPVYDELQRAWQIVVEREAEADANFKKIWSSLTAFRAEYANWRRLGHMP
jgi:TRAP-type mannitol/chloroaromatic compound transport system substrate-binding protein